MTFVKKYTPYLVMAGVLFFAYYPVLTGYYLHTDDYYWSKWGISRADSFMAATVAGRPLTGFVWQALPCVGQLAWMNLLRFLSVCNLCVAAFLLFHWLCCYKYDRWFSCFLSAAIFTLPPFQVYASYLSTASFGIAVTLSILALILVHRGLGLAGSRGGGFYPAAILLLVMAFCLYQPCVCFYLTLLVVPFLTEKNLGSFIFWRKILICLLVFAGAVLLYYLPWRCWLQWAAIPFASKYDGRVFVHDIGQRWQWFMNGPFIEASNFWNIYPLQGVSYGFIGFLGMVFLGRLIVQNKGNSIKTWGFDGLRYGVLLLLIPVSFFVILVSSGPTMEYRTYSALSATLLLLGILPLVFSENTRYRLFLSSITFLLMITGACWAHRTVKDYFAVPDSKEIRFIIKTIRDAQLHGQADFSGVAMAGPRHTIAPSRRNEIGQPTTTHPPNIRPLVMTALNELGIKKSSIRVDTFEDMFNLYWHEYGMIINGQTPPPQLIYKQDIIIDMDKISYKHDVLDH